MKKLLIASFLLFVLYPTMHRAQFTNFVDPVLLKHRNEYTLLIKEATKQKELVAESYNKLTEIEKNYQNKIKGADGDVNSFASFLVYRLINVNELATNIALNIAIAKDLTRENYKIKNEINEFETELSYLIPLKNDLETPAIFNPKTIGGAGYSINYLMKIYLRLVKVESRLLKLEYETNEMLNLRWSKVSSYLKQMNSSIDFNYINKKLKVFVERQIKFNNKFASIYNINTNKLQFTNKTVNYTVFDHLNKNKFIKHM